MREGGEQRRTLEETRLIALPPASFVYPRGFAEERLRSICIFTVIPSKRTLVAHGFGLRTRHGIDERTGLMGRFSAWWYQRGLMWLQPSPDTVKISVSQPGVF